MTNKQVIKKGKVQFKCLPTILITNLLSIILFSNDLFSLVGNLNMRLYIPPKPMLVYKMPMWTKMVLECTYRNSESCPL